VWPSAARLDTTKINGREGGKQARSRIGLTLKLAAQLGFGWGSGWLHAITGGEEKAGDCRVNKAEQHLMPVPQMSGNVARPRHTQQHRAPYGHETDCRERRQLKESAKSVAEARQHLAIGSPVRSPWLSFHRLWQHNSPHRC
jgi:hypothetical protein